VARRGYRGRGKVENIVTGYRRNEVNKGLWNKG
jgi:hypothetical protein